MIRAMLAAAAVTATPGPNPAEPLTGKFTTGWERVPSLELVVKQDGKALRGGLTFVADHRGVRVLTVVLQGRVAGQAGHFTWRDAYGNEGVATLWPKDPTTWRLESIIKKPANYGRWFEGRFDLAKTQHKLAPGEIPED